MAGNKSFGSEYVSAMMSEAKYFMKAFTLVGVISSTDGTTIRENWKGCVIKW